MAYKTKNPALNDKTFSSMNQDAVAGPPMTLAGTAQKSFLLLCTAAGAAAYSWHTFYSGVNPNGVLGVAGGASLVAFILAMVIILNKKTAPVLSWFYAAFEGLLLGALSAAFEKQYHGTVLNTVGLTFGTFLAMLMAYQSGLIKPTDKFKIGVVAATGGVLLVYILDLVATTFFHVPVTLIQDTGTAGILFSAFVVIIAALNLVLDFDFIQSGVANRAPKYMEWYSAFGLLVTLVWLYLEILRMLSKARSR